MLVEEQGPFKILGQMRRATEDWPWIDFDCFKCTSVWVAAPVALFSPSFLLYWLALSAVAIIIQALMEYIDGV